MLTTIMWFKVVEAREPAIGDNVVSNAHKQDVKSRLAMGPTMTRDTENALTQR